MGRVRAQGARAVGVRSIFVCGGVHAAELGIETGPMVMEHEPPPGMQSGLEGALGTLFETHGGLRPTHALTGFVW